jgi:hypothetical protein
MRNRRLVRESTAVVIGVLALATACGRRGVTVKAEDVVGTWSVTTAGDLSEINDPQGVLPLRVSGRTITLQPGGDCSLSVMAPPGATPTGTEAAGMRHPDEGCRWTVGSQDGRSGSAVYLDVIRAGYKRGMVFRVLTRSRGIVLDPSTDEYRSRLLLSRSAVVTPSGR